MPHTEICAICSDISKSVEVDYHPYQLSRYKMNITWNIPSGISLDTRNFICIPWICRGILHAFLVNDFLLGYKQYD